MKQYRGLFSCLLGIIIVILSFLAIIKQSLLLVRIFDILGMILIIHGFHEGYKYFFKHRRRIHITDAFLMIFIGILMLFSMIPLAFVTLVFSLYLTLNGIIKFITYLNYRHDKVRGRIYVLIGSIVLCLNGYALLFRDSIDLDLIMVIIGLYGLMLGITYIFDGIFIVIPQKKKESIKRKLRIPLPIFLSALIPASLSSYINSRLETTHKERVYENDDVDLEVFVHVSPDGFGLMGHCDLYFDHEVLSYGNYDPESKRLFDAIGDGVLFTLQDKKAYIEFCIAEDNKTIFAYGLKLTEKQKENVRKKIRELKENSISWYPESYKDHEWTKDYASRLYLKTKATFYKFKSGKFKTYYVLGTNCVLLADRIIGSAGTDIIDLNGIIAPGTYQEYLETEYFRPNGFVVKRKIYR